MQNIEYYANHWKQHQIAQHLINKKNAEEARKTLYKVIDLLVHKFQVKKIILFGSLAKGNFDLDSDIDLAVEGISASDYFHVLAKVNSVSDRWIDLKPIESLEPHFLQRVLQTGECLYASDISK